MAEMGALKKENPLPSPAFTNNHHEHTLKEESWKHRAPYQIQPPEKFGPVKWRAKCKCGKISYSIRQDKPLNAKFCHCRGCQVMHGAPFQWAAIFQKEDVNFARGAAACRFIRPPRIRKSTRCLLRCRVLFVIRLSWMRGGMFVCCFLN
jgi:hypothetical protein